MQYQIFSENEWLYPDSEIKNAGNKAVLYSARNADVCFQVLTDLELTGGEGVAFEAESLACEPIVYQLLPAHVEENSHVKLYTTLDYDSVKHFVTRQAPFDVYDVTRPLEDGKLYEGRAAFYVRLNVAADAEPGQYEGAVKVTVGGELLTLPVSLKIYQAQIPVLKDGHFDTDNWIEPPIVKRQHNIEIMSEEYEQVVRYYLEQQHDMRTNSLLIPPGDPIRDENGKVVDFDFRHAEMMGNLALEYGFEFLYGGYMATWKKWDEPGLYLVWDKEIDANSQEAYRQLRLYFGRVKECIEKNHWQGHYMQSLVDEPQFATKLDYKGLSSICRGILPGVKITDPVETTEIAGAIDIWVVKQAIYEKYLDTYKALQELGENIQLYACGFPSGSMMNHIIDLPLLVSRIFMWVCYHYQCPGYHHFGYMQHNPEGEKATCFRRRDHKFPPGNAFLVYPAQDDPYKVWYSVRAHQRRMGVCDYELFYQLGEKCSYETVDALITQCCRGFEDYNTDAAQMEEIRRQVLELLG